MVRMHMHTYTHIPTSPCCEVNTPELVSFLQTDCFFKPHELVSFLQTDCFFKPHESTVTYNDKTITLCMSSYALYETPN